MGSPFPSAAGATMVGTPVKDPSDATTYYLTAIDGTGAANVWTLDTSTGIYTLRFTDSLAVYTDSFLIYAFGSIILGARELGDARAVEDHVFHEQRRNVALNIGVREYPKRGRLDGDPQRQ